MATSRYPQAEKALADTHEVQNQPPLLEDYNTYLGDQAAQEMTARFGAGRHEQALIDHGALTGSAAMIELGFQANAHKPELHTHDRRGHRIDEVRFHPAYHQLMQTALEQGLHSSPWTDPGPGAHVKRALKYYLHAQVEAAHGCPVTMTFAAMPTLRKNKAIAEDWLPKVFARAYDGRNVPYTHKQALTLGMAMTEKQGGSDVRANTTVAHPLETRGGLKSYELVGHKYFVSAPMSDAFLVLAQAPEGLSCFLLPRWRPDGSKNPLQIQRLKNKMGNVANASSETELRGALAWLIGEPGRGVRTIIEMVALTRYDCMIGSSAGMRQATAQAIHHCRHRKAFGAALSEQPLMQNVLADLALESEAALAYTLRMAQALDNADDENEQRLIRIGTAIGKYWICKRTPQHAYEAMECIGGSGLMEDCIMPRLFRESPVNAIWEGSGNIQCLDVLRSMDKEPDALEVFMAEVSLAAGAHPLFDDFMASLQEELEETDNLSYRARTLTEHLALAMQASLLLRGSNMAVADAFCQSRLQPGIALNYGNLPAGVDCAAIIERAAPVQ
ncbi:MAG: acyl-CoA dehydrogenase family protein [Natronospirillum sp.]|uniref:acyl-CoA dehydrogenase family protein n=1 Tax=Natronospirillum sp. TaxID=2812955 RepID=UPI0025E42DD8|nr:acyl-CoA dehydrogenase family protein [Natronospirillum sp.]MCH8553194.1 acyl-CoA dehydrogenase family protein [Natronospirillum sp.]